MSMIEDLLKQYQKQLVSVDYSSEYASYLFEFKSFYRVIIFNKTGRNRCEVEILVSNKDTKNVPKYSSIQKESLSDMKSLGRVLKNVDVASRFKNRIVYDFM